MKKIDMIYKKHLWTDKKKQPQQRWKKDVNREFTQEKRNYQQTCSTLTISNAR